MRIVWKFGLVPDASSASGSAGPLGLQAAADTDPHAPPREHWVTLTSTVKQLLSVGGVALALVAMRVQTKSDIAVLKDAHETAAHRADLQGEKIAAVQATVIPRDQYLGDWSRQNAINLQLATTQTQILLQRCRAEGN